MSTIIVPAGISLEPGVPTVIAVADGVAHSAKGWGQTATLHPPAEWVELEAKCETCMGQTRYEGDGWTCPNPRCHNGRLLHEVRVMEDRSNGGGVSHETVGYRTVLVTLDVVPVVGEGYSGPFPCLFVGRGSAFYLPHEYQLHGGRGEISLLPDHVEALGRVEPGMFALVATPTE